MRRRLLINGIEETKAGDICLYDSINDSKVIVPYDIYTLEEYPSVQYTPIGVVAVPNSHMPDMTSRVISLKLMCDTNPDNGTTNYDESRLYYGGYGTHVDGLKQLGWCGLIGTANPVSFPDEQTIIEWRETNCFIPSDYFANVGTQCPYDTKSWYGGFSGITSFSPSPYLENGKPNEFYSMPYVGNDGKGSRTEYADGKENTRLILELDNATDTSWQTADTLSNETSVSYIHPCAQACWRYHTVGTSQGDWYLPSTFELGYFAARWATIDRSFKRIIEYGFESTEVRGNTNVCTSSENNEEIAFHIYFGLIGDREYIDVYLSGKGSLRYVFAFLAV